MSGGSLNYLYCKDVDELYYHLDDLEKVEEYLLKNNIYDIAKDVRRLIEYIKTSRNRIEVLHENLSGVFKAIEYHISRDCTQDVVDKAIERYRIKFNYVVSKDREIEDKNVKKRCGDCIYFTEESQFGNNLGTCRSNVYTGCGVVYSNNKINCPCFKPKID